MTAGGLFVILAALAGAPKLGLVFLLGSALAPVVYSWRLARHA
jgi:urea transporter